MITSPLAPGQLRIATSPDNYWGMAAAGPLHPYQERFVNDVIRDPAKLGFEGSPEEGMCLQVAAVYTLEDERGNHAAQMWERIAANPWARSAEADIQPNLTPYEDAIVRETHQSLMTHSDTRVVMDAARDLPGRNYPFNPLYEAEARVLFPWGTPNTSRQAMRQILTRHENSLLQPVVTRLRSRMAAVTPEQAAREIDGGLLYADRVYQMVHQTDNEWIIQAELGAAQRAFRRAGTTQMPTGELLAQMGIESYRSVVIHSLARLGAVRRTSGGDRVHAGRMLHVEQGRIGHAAFVIGECLLHHTGMRRCPELRTV